LKVTIQELYTESVMDSPAGEEAPNIEREREKLSMLQASLSLSRYSSAVKHHGQFLNAAEVLMLFFYKKMLSKTTGCAPSQINEYSNASRQQRN